MIALVDPVLDFGPTKKTKRADFIFEKVTITQTYEGKKKWKIYSDSAEINKDNHNATLQQVTGYFFENDTPIFSIEAPLARINLETSNIRLKESKSIAMFKEDPINILADSLSWDSNSRQFIATGNVEIFSGDLNMKGKEFLVDLNTKKIKLNKSQVIIADPNKKSNTKTPVKEGIQYEN